MAVDADGGLVLQQVATPVTSTQIRNRRFLKATCSAVGAAGMIFAATPLVAAVPAGAPAAETGVDVQDSPASLPHDPWQGMNRQVFGFSMLLDRYLVAPIAHTYMHMAPSPVRRRVSMVVDNLGEPGTVINDVAQGHPRRAGVATARFMINSTVGLLGMFDVAAKMDLPSHDADFGQTLGRYGAEAGPYIYVPLVGPSDLRDGLGRIVDILVDPVSLATGGFTTTFGATRVGVTVLDVRARSDVAFRALDDATDPYATARSGYTQHRVSVVQSATGAVEALPDFDSPMDARPSADSDHPK
ncbi:VacJ family lipoprotein [Phenylobacterium sp.]|jgi:phospholipid-binding lipoprotein MlaA|uniref:MlaA family lipoprotein n=1 Tax=Phenylobacterium sp. TaxID=1871053 RepID=UPI002F427278